MKTARTVLAGTLIAASSLTTASQAQTPQAQTPCVTQNMAVPPGANTTDKGKPFFIDTTGLDLGTQPPTRDPKNPNYPQATELPDGALPPTAAEGNFIIGPTHAPAPETVAKDGVPKGATISFTMSSADSVIYNPGLIRDDVAGCTNSSIMVTTSVPGDKSNMIVTTSHPGTWTRRIEVYVPPNTVPGTELPFIMLGDGGSAAWKDMNVVLDNLIRERRVPPMVSIQIGNGGQDAQGAQRGREYDTVSEAYSQFVQREVLPLVEQHAGVKLTGDPEGRATMGLSSSGAAAFIMAWFNPDLYHRVLAYSPTMVNQQWPWNPALRGGAWEFHSPWTGPVSPNLTVKDGALVPSGAPGAPLIPNAPAKPIRYWFEMGDQDLFYPNPTIPDGMHDWTLSAELMAKALTAKGYHYQFLFARNARHVDRPTIAQTLPAALEWLWKGYPIP
jgi:hypothetical protein